MRELFIVLGLMVGMGSASAHQGQISNEKFELKLRKWERAANNCAN
jgi:hypothetical protein